MVGIFILIALIGAVITLISLWEMSNENSDLSDRLKEAEKQCRLNEEQAEIHKVYADIQKRGNHKLRAKIDHLTNALSDVRDRIRVNVVKEQILEARLIRHSSPTITSIRFTARVPAVGYTKTTFKLGLGPCGKYVKHLEFKEEHDRYIITQSCTDGEHKQFIYFKIDVAGRIEIALSDNQ